MVIELRRGRSPEVVLNNLYKHTMLQSVFGINMVALVDGQPRLLNLKQMLEAFLRHRREVVTRRTIFDLRKARDRAHVLEGLAVALANIDAGDRTDQGLRVTGGGQERAAGATVDARAWSPTMLERPGRRATRPEDLAPNSVWSRTAIDCPRRRPRRSWICRLHRLTGLEQEKIVNEYKELLDKIQDYLIYLPARTPVRRDPQRAERCVTPWLMSAARRSSRRGWI